MADAGTPTIGGTSISAGNPWVFFGAVYAVTWSLLLGAVVWGVSFESVEGAVIQLATLVGIGIVGVGFTSLVYGDRGLSDLWTRIRQVRRVGLLWFLVILLVPLVVTLGAAVADVLLSGPGVTLGAWTQEVGTNPLVFVPTLFFSTLPPLFEEIGWRGYALDRLQLNRSALTAGVLLGIVWAGWHLPLFFIRGAFLHDVVGFATLGFGLFMIGTVSLSVIFSWVYNHTSRSVLGAVVLHGWVNFVSQSIEVADQFYYPVWVLAAVLVVGIWGAKTLTSAADVPRPPERR
jgi:membrane protease YdiL (CAAX protease family)